MSYTSREKKRRRRIAQGRSRERHRETMEGRWYLTIVKRLASCNRCGTRLRLGGECVFRFKPKTIYCPSCANAIGISPRPSLAWERVRKKS
jgi:hypothetical protein